ncbi:GNAT family N-acetyltransferase [Spirilliplanes yamanashiensis]|uniref:N-acetyltransferase domain-containing protein n=1 Tax=Spirilliplanes yamanashiensis TaxID=42233 RepID=A0A8J4DLR5_9ACTN|nr:GNAT family N-acetyltransferase [Spirilliplanes yamanashiensis]MDP9818254.1 L-amino acid N-acyltransferase YncA [Spirilliplanes yamanashiensis]GIJ06672.1 hypothetical protein Sya03_60240 [Spirilliplanes yamanashiensis]
MNHDEPVDTRTTDGAAIRLRPAVPADLPAVRHLYDRASTANLRSRFPSLPSRPEIEADARRICRARAPGRHTVVADLAGELVGVGSYERCGWRRADFSVFVDERHHGRGIGALLLEQLAAAARRDGVVELTGDVLGGNSAMLSMAGHLPPGARTSIESGIVTVEVPTSAPGRPEPSAAPPARAVPRRRGWVSGR